MSGACSLDISFSRIDAVPPRLYSTRAATARLAGLVYMDMSHNLLTRLPESDPAVRTVGPSFLFYLASLLFLDLSHNKLAALPDDVSRCGTLRELRLSRNALTALPPAFFEMPALEVLDVSHNLLSALPESLLRAPALTALNVSSNVLLALPQECATRARRPAARARVLDVCVCVRWRRYAPTEEELSVEAAFTTGNALIDEALNAAVAGRCVRPCVCHACARRCARCVRFDLARWAAPRRRAARAWLHCAAGVRGAPIIVMARSRVRLRRALSVTTPLFLSSQRRPRRCRELCCRARVPAPARARLAAAPPLPGRVLQRAVARARVPLRRTRARGSARRMEPAHWSAPRGPRLARAR